MRLDSARKLFFGVKIDSKLREAMALATPGDKHYWAEDSQFLRVINKDEEQWLGKIVDCGFAPSEVDDISRNVVSILNRVAPGTRHSASTIRVFSIDENAPAVPPAPPRNDDRDGGRGGGGFDGGRGGYGSYR